MSKENSKKELMRYGNFMITGILDKSGHMCFIEIRATSNNWKMRIDDTTFMYGLILNVYKMNDKNPDKKNWDNYLHSCISVIFNFGTCGIPIEMLPEIDKLLRDFIEKQSKPEMSKKEEKKYFSDLKKEYELKEKIK